MTESRITIADRRLYQRLCPQCSTGIDPASDAWAPAKPRPDKTLIRALARAHRWKRLLEAGSYRSAAEVAEAESVTRSFVNRLLRLTLLAPDVQEAILDGRQPKRMQLEELTRATPSDWNEQKTRLQFSSHDLRSGGCSWG
jgi:hypothetical protein